MATTYKLNNQAKMTEDVESFVPGVGQIVDGQLTNAPDDLESANLTKVDGQPPAQPPAPAAPVASTPQPQPASPAPVASAAPVQPAQPTANQETN